MRLALDREDVQSGMMLGRSAALAEWAFRREKRAFEAVVNRLRVRKWALEHPEKRRAIANRYAAKPTVRARQTRLARERRQRRFRDRAEIFACAECGVEWCRVPWRKHGGKRPKFCGTACASRDRYQRITPGARRIKRRS